MLIRYSSHNSQLIMELHRPMAIVCPTNSSLLILIFYQNPAHQLIEFFCDEGSYLGDLMIFGPGYDLIVSGMIGSIVYQVIAAASHD